MKQQTHIPTRILAIGLLAGTIHAAPVIEESFDYELGLNVSGQNGGTGFTGAWSNTRNQPKVAEPDLSWGSLLTAGNYARGNAWSALIRPIGDTSALDAAGLMDNGATLWFSVVMDLDGQNTTNADINVALATDGFVPNVFGDRENLVAGEGIGVTHSRAQVQGVYWQDSDADTVAERVEEDSSTIINSTPPNMTRALIVGKIEWGADDLASEKLTLYAPDTTLALGAPTMAEWTIPALDQSAFDLVVIQFKDQSQVDEIRFGATSDDVLPVPPDTSVKISSITGVGGGVWEVMLTGEADTGYQFLSSPILDFENGTVVENLTAGGVPVGTIGGANDSLLTTDGDGNGTVRMTLSSPRDFVRAQIPPPQTLFSENFDTTLAGSLPTDWAAGKNVADNSSLTNWELGTPSVVGPIPPGVPLPSADNCVATNIGANYDDPVADLGVAHTDIWLRTAVIDISGFTAATLTFQQWTQIEDVPGDLDYGSIRILDADDDSELVVMESQSIDGSTSGWEESSMALPAEAFTATAGTIRVEFRFEADDIDSLAGWYIDDVAVTVPGS